MAVYTSDGRTLEQRLRQIEQGVMASTKRGIEECEAIRRNKNIAIVGVTVTDDGGSGLGWLKQFESASKPFGECLVVDQAVDRPAQPARRPPAICRWSHGRRRDFS